MFTRVSPPLVTRATRRISGHYEPEPRSKPDSRRIARCATPPLIGRARRSITPRRPPSRSLALTSTQPVSSATPAAFTKAFPPLATHAIRRTLRALRIRTTCRPHSRRIARCATPPQIGRAQRSITPRKPRFRSLALTLTQPVSNAIPAASISGLSTACYSCHATDYAGATNPNHASLGYPQDCSLCHSTTNWFKRYLQPHHCRLQPGW